MAPPTTRTPQANILVNNAGIARPANAIQTIADSYELFITPEIITIIATETNRRAVKVYTEWNNSHPDQQQAREWKGTDSIEIKAFIGLLLLAGVHRSKNESLTELFSPSAGKAIFLATMSLDRFCTLMRFCRFDNIDTRTQRMPDDKLAPIRDIWAMFIARLAVCYKPGESMTVDEQLIPTRGRCSFRQYIPSKPGKYGIKVFWCCDSATAYPLKGEVYLGRQPSGAQADPATRGNSGLQLVKRLVAPWINSGRNVTMDNFFTSAELAEDMLGVKTTIVGTIRATRREVPGELAKNRQRDQYSSLFCFDRQLSLVSYVPKKGKAVVLLSTMHHDKTVDTDNKAKPEIIQYYNGTKAGVDRMDQLARTYSCKRKNNRWPMTFFSNMLDVAGIAALVVWLSKNPDWNANKHYRRRLFLNQLGNELISDQLERRLETPQALQRGVRAAMQAIGRLDTRPRPNDQAPAVTGKRRCQLCPRREDRKVLTRCAYCEVYCCPRHHSVICDTCQADV